MKTSEDHLSREAALSAAASRTHDALGRRLRQSGPCQSKTRLMLTEGDYRVFEALDRHGPLPTHYLHALSQDLRRNYSNLQWRLTQLFNGAGGKPYLVRPPQQFASFHARYQHMVYDLAPRARLMLGERGTLIRHPPMRNAPFLHQLMQACVAASFEITTGKMGLRYISRNEILTREAAGGRQAARVLSLPVGEREQTLIPDDLFGIEYPGVGFRFFALEVDRNTESIERSVSNQTSIGKKVADYMQALCDRRYREHWGIPNLTILAVTTNSVHARNILAYWATQAEGQFAERFLVTVQQDFSSNWRVPQNILSQVLTAEWSMVTGTRSIGVA